MKEERPSYLLMGFLKEMKMRKSVMPSLRGGLVCPRQKSQKLRKKTVDTGEIQILPT